MARGNSYRSFKGASQASPKTSRKSRKKGSLKGSINSTGSPSKVKSSLNEDELNFSHSGFLTDLSEDEKQKQPKQQVKSSRSSKPQAVKPEIEVKEEDQQVIQIALEREQKQKLE